MNLKKGNQYTAPYIRFIEYIGQYNQQKWFNLKKNSVICDQNDYGTAWSQSEDTVGKLKI